MKDCIKANWKYSRLCFHRTNSGMKIIALFLRTKEDLQINLFIEIIPRNFNGAISSKAITKIFYFFSVISTKFEFSFANYSFEHLSYRSSTYRVIKVVRKNKVAQKSCRKTNGNRSINRNLDHRKVWPQRS